MEKAIIILIIIFYSYLIIERLVRKKQRRSFSHVVHVNGTRGKSTVTRMIYSGLKAGGIKAYCKTTGTIPSTIDPSGKEEEILRRGAASIKEQLKIMGLAHGAGTEVLVVECMALTRELQWVSGRQMLEADVGVITNARLDHTDVMGDTLEKIRDSLTFMVPKDGICFTADESFLPALKASCEALGGKAVLTETTNLPDFDFKENVGLALAVCEHLGVPREKALEGILNYPEDPYVFKVYETGGGGLFASGMSINDIDSARQVLGGLKEDLFKDKDLTIILNIREDRSFRSEQFADFIVSENPKNCIVLGKGNRSVVNRIRKTLGVDKVQGYKSQSEINLEDFIAQQAVFATGNLGGEGILLADRIKKEGRECRTK